MSEKRSRSAIGIVLGLLLVLAIGLKLFDLRARAGAQKLFDAVTEKLELGESLSDADVHQLYGEPTNGSSTGDHQWTDRYVFRGVFRSFSVLIQYSDRAARLVQGVEME